MWYQHQIEDGNWNLRENGMEIIMILDLKSSYSGFSGWKSTRRSVTGFYVFMENILVTVKSSMQKTVALSVTE